MDHRAILWCSQLQALLAGTIEAAVSVSYDPSAAEQVLKQLSDDKGTRAQQGKKKGAGKKPKTNVVREREGGGEGEGVGEGVGILLQRCVAASISKMALSWSKLIELFFFFYRSRQEK